MKTKETTETLRVAINGIEASIRNLIDRVYSLEKKPFETPANKAPKVCAFEVDLETKRQMNITAQALGLRSGEELSQIILHAFLEMYESEEGSITFPLMLAQVPTA